MPLPMITSSPTVTLRMSGRALAADLVVSPDEGNGVSIGAAGLTYQAFSQPAARIEGAAFQSLTLPAVSGSQVVFGSRQVVSFGSVRTDSGVADTGTAMSDLAGQPTRLTFQAPGLYRCGAGVDGQRVGSPLTAGDMVKLWLVANGTVDLAERDSVLNNAVDRFGCCVQPVLYRAAIGDYIEAYVQVALTTSTTVSSLVIPYNLAELAAGVFLSAILVQP